MHACFKWLTITLLTLNIQSALSKNFSETLSVLTFNVENLFDTEDDPQKSDETFLPKHQKQNKKHKDLCEKIEVYKWKEDCLNLDWNKAILSQKMKRIGSIIKEANNGQGADIVFLQEVENLDVLELLNKKELSKLSYKSVLIEGADQRGIDVALMTKLQVLETKLIEIPFNNLGKRKGDTRGLLNVRLKASNGTNLSVYSVHLPAPFHPTSLRKEALLFLNKLASEDSKNGYLVVAAGDFNITHKEESEDKILEPYKRQWQISHIVGCRDCKGTTYYERDKTWSFLDQIWVYPLNNYGLAPGSVKILNQEKAQIDPQTSGPNAFKVGDDGKTSEGVSDHWPLYAEIISNK